MTVDVVRSQGLEEVVPSERVLLSGRKNLQVNARIFQLVIHFELGNRDLLEYLLRSFRKSLSPRSIYNSVYAVISTYFHALLRAVDRSDEQELSRELKEELPAVLASIPGKEHSQMFEFLFWLESQIIDRPLSYVYHERLIADGRMVE